MGAEPIKKVEVLSPKVENLKEMKAKMQAYLNKLDAAMPTEEDAQSVQELGTISLPNEESKAYPKVPPPPKAVKYDDGLKVPDHPTEELKKQVLAMAIKKAAKAAVTEADAKNAQKLAESSAKHTAIVQNLTAVALKAKAVAVGAKWKVQQARKEKEKDLQHWVHLQEEVMKMKLMEDGLKEQEAQLVADTAEAKKETDAASAKVKDLIKKFKETAKIYEESKDTLAEAKADAMMDSLQNNPTGSAHDKIAMQEEKSVERFLSLR